MRMLKRLLVNDKCQQNITLYKSMATARFFSFSSTTARLKRILTSSLADRYCMLDSPLCPKALACAKVSA